MDDAQYASALMGVRGAGYTAQPRVRTSVLSLAVVNGVSLIDGAAFGLLLPVIPVLYPNLTDVDASNQGKVYGLLVSAFYVAQYTGSLVLTWVAHTRVGFKPTILFGITLLCAAYGFSANVTTALPLLLSRVSAGFFSGTVAVCEAYLRRVCDAGAVRRQQGIMGGVGTLGLMLGPFVGGVIASEMGASTALTVCSLVVAFSFFLLFFVGLLYLREPVHVLPSLEDEAEQSFPVWRRFVEIFDIRSFASLCMFTVCHSFAMAAFELATPLFLTLSFTVGASWVGGVFSLFATLMLFTQSFLYVQLTPWLGLGMLGVLGPLATAGILASLPFVSLGAFVAMCGLLGCAHGMVVASWTVFGTAIAGWRPDPLVDECRLMCGTVTRAIAPAVLGYTYDRRLASVYTSREHHFAGERFMTFWCGAGAALVALVFAVRVSRNKLVWGDDEDTAVAPGEDWLTDPLGPGLGR